MRKNPKQSELQRVDVAPFVFSPAAPSQLECTQSFKLNPASLSIADPSPAVSAAFTIPVQQGQQRQKCCRSHPNTRGSAGIETSQRSVKWPPPPRDLRWTASFCTPWSIPAPSFVAVGQLCSVRRAATVPSSTCTSPSSRLALRDGKTDKWVKNGDGKAICQLHKVLQPAVPIPGRAGCELLFGTWKPTLSY